MTDSSMSRLVEIYAESNGMVSLDANSRADLADDLRNHPLEDSERTLEQLGAILVEQIEIDRQCEKGSTAAKLREGEVLIFAKSQLNHGDWLPWLRANGKLEPRVATDRMKHAFLVQQEPSANRKALSDLGWMELKAHFKRKNAKPRSSQPRRHLYPNLSAPLAKFCADMSALGRLGQKVQQKGRDSPTIRDTARKLAHEVIAQADYLDGYPEEMAQQGTDRATSRKKNVRKTKGKSSSGKAPPGPKSRTARASTASPADACQIAELERPH